MIKNMTEICDKLNQNRVANGCNVLANFDLVDSRC